MPAIQLQSQIGDGAWKHKARRVNATECVIAQWEECSSIASCGRHHFWFETGCAGGFGSRFPPACCPGRMPFEPDRTSSRFRASKRRQNYCCCAEAQSGCNRGHHGFVVWWRWQDCHLGQRRGHASSPRPNQKCSADSCHSLHSTCFCGNFGQWPRCDMGITWPLVPLGPWWRQHQSHGWAQECSADSCNERSFCCTFCRGKGHDVGQPWSWRRQRRSPGPAKECSKDSCRFFCLCCNFKRWQRCDMGRSGLWRWHY